jgi:hypothetical protein
MGAAFNSNDTTNDNDDDSNNNNNSNSNNSVDKSKKRKKAEEEDEGKSSTKKGKPTAANKPVEDEDPLNADRSSFISQFRQVFNKVQSRIDLDAAWYLFLYFLFRLFFFFFSRNYPFTFPLFCIIQVICKPSILFTAVSHLCCRSQPFKKLVPWLVLTVEEIIPNLALS